MLFRGKDFSGALNRSWMFGSLDTTENEYTIMIYPDRFGNKCRIFIDPKTVGQYIDLTDKNGKKIFEGDILKPDYDNSSYYRVAWDSGKLHLNIEEYCFNDFEGKALWSWCENIAQYQINGCVDNCEIIGNIYDNPKLLEVDE